MHEREYPVKPVRRPVSRFVGLFSLIGLSVLAGCAVVPSDGPVASRVDASAVQDNSLVIPQIDLAFDVIRVDQRVANNVTQLGQPSLSRTFGFGGGTQVPVLGVGDVISVIIFEAGPDGLFSTSDKKSTSIPVIIQPDGRGQIPYVGSVKFAGMTLDSARTLIVNALKSKAVEPDVIVTMQSNASRTVSVQGAVGRPSIIQLTLAPQSLMRVIANAGGPLKSPYDSYVTLTRGNKVGTVLLQTVIDRPKEDVNLQPGDKVFVTYDPRTFSALGASLRVGNIPLESNDVNLVEAVARAGGGNPLMADAKGFFVFRYEYEAVYRSVAGDERFRELLAKGLMANRDGLYPIVYRFDMSDPQSFIVTQSFPIRNKDVLYISHHPATDFAKFMALVNAPLASARAVDLLRQD